MTTRTTRLLWWGAGGMLLVVLVCLGLVPYLVMTRNSRPADEPGPKGGLRVWEVGKAPLYFTLDGAYHHIPDPVVYERLFGRGPGGDPDVRQEKTINHRHISPLPLGVDADVRKGDAKPHVYFVSNGERRQIVHPSFLDRAFGGRFRTVPQAELDALPLADPIDEP